MFWKYLRWGGTLMVMLLVLAALFLTGQSEETHDAVQPVDAQQPVKNFNL
jgi:hypothetical protein